MPTKAFDFIERQVSAGRIVGIGQKDDLGTRCDGAEDRVDIGRIVTFRHHDWPTSRAQGCSTEDQKAMNRVDRLVAGSDKCVGEEVEQFIGTRAAHDQRGIERISASDHRSQRGTRAVGIDCEMRGRFVIGTHRIRARPERRLIRRELKDSCPLGCGVAAGHIRLDLEHARTRFGTFESQHCFHRLEH